MLCLFGLFFYFIFLFFKQKTAYEMRISDWSSDVCSSDLHGVPHVVCNPQNLDDVFDDIRRIASALRISARGEALVAAMQAAMPACAPSANAPRVLVEWWPKPVIGAARRSWIHDLIERAGGINALATVAAHTPSNAADRKSTRLNSSH